ncbi:magnesium transporter [Actinomycetaceae bacterium L2_0104]
MALDIDINNVSGDINQALSDNDLTTTVTLLNPLTSNEVVSVLERLNVKQRAVAYRLLPKDEALEVFENLDPALQGELVQGLRDEDVAALFASLDPDDRVWLMDELPASVARELMLGLPSRDRALTAEVLGYPKNSVGRRMSPEYVTTHPTLTVAQTLQRIQLKIDAAETIYTIPVLDSGRKVVGVVELRDLLAADGATQVYAIMAEAETVAAVEEAETAARRCTDLGAWALPVVDSESRLVGILTIDDAVRILEYEESQDAARQGGTEDLRRPYLSTSIFTIVRSRVVWLLVLAVGASLTVQVLSAFEATLAQMTALSLFVPLLIGTGGNTGNQAATTVTRALALGDVRPGDLLKVMGREIRVGFVLGALLGSIGFLITGAIFGFDIGLVIGLTLLAVCTVAATIGGMMPLIARFIHVDPAVFSNPFISTFTDATGLIIYFLIAKAVLGI